MRFLILALLLTLGIGCNKSGGGAFENLEDDQTDVLPPPPGAVKIRTFTPSQDPVIFTSTSNVTFALSIFDGAGTVNYDFVLDDTISLQNSESPFLEIVGSTLGTGNHTLKVTASNTTSSDSKVFNLRRNNLPTVVSFNPSLTGSMLNCSQDTLTMNAVTTDSDSDPYTHKWLIDGVEVTGTTPFVSVSNTASSAQIAYSPDCSVAGFHQFTLQIYDGFETTNTTWSVSVVNPAVETIISYFPTSNNITALSTETSKTFNASGSGVGSLTFTWKLDGVVVKTDTGVVSSNFILDTSSGILSTGNHTLLMTLTDSTLANDPPLPVSRSWLIYKNQKPTILSPSPSDSKLMNLNTQLALSANLQDALDTFTATITKGALDCNPISECGLSSVVLPTTSGTFSSIFTPGSTFLGENNFQLKVTDSYGEFETYSFNVTANYFSDACNNLSAGRICTISGLPGLGSGLNTTTEANKVRVSPSWLTQDDQGNWFFSDHSTNTVWYHNTKSTPVTLWANSLPSATIVPANSIFVVAGTGVAGSGGAGQLARKVPLNFGNQGGGLAWDSVRKELYIADYSNSRVIRIGQNGIGNTFCGASNLNTQNSVASNNECINPVDIEFDNSNRRVYVSLQARHIIKYFDVNDALPANWRGFILAGAYNTAANTNGTTNLTAFPSSTVAGTSRLNQPWGLKLDITDNILYFTEYGSCRLRALGLPGSTSRTVASQSITSNNVFTLAGNGCGSPAVNTNTALGNNLFNRPMDVELLKSGANVNGLFVSDFGGNRISFINNTASAIVLGNQTINAGNMNNVLGNGTSVPSNPPSGLNSVILSPFGLSIKNNVLYTGARLSSFIKTMDISIGNGAVSTYLGGIPRAGYSGNAPIDSKLVTFNAPLTLIHKPVGNLLYVSDTANAMIRSINLTTGRVEDFIGTGTAGQENLINTVTTATRLITPRGMAFYNDFFLYADGANNNCFIRAYNPLATDELIFNTLVNQNRTSPVAGFYNWCGSAFGGISPLATTDPNSRIQNPYGIGVDSDNDTMYITSNNSHCVLKVNGAGMMVPVIGSCGTAGGAPIYGGSYPDLALQMNAPAELIMDPLYPGNFFLVDFSNSALAHVKYANLTQPGGVSFFAGAEYISPDSVGTVLAATSSPGFIRALAAFEDWICFTSGTTTSGQGNNTVVCRNRDSGVQQVFGLAGAGGIQLETEQEGASVISGGSTVTFAAPSGLAFDSDGNLFVSEQGSHVIRMIKKWW